jgi:hypothetical protein
MVPGHFSAHDGIFFVAQVEIRPDAHTAEPPWGFGFLDVKRQIKWFWHAFDAGVS